MHDSVSVLRYKKLLFVKGIWIPVQIALNDSPDLFDWLMHRQQTVVVFTWLLDLNYDIVCSRVYREDNLLQDEMTKKLKVGI